MQKRCQDVDYRGPITQCIFFCFCFLSFRFDGIILSLRHVYVCTRVHILVCTCMWWGWHLHICVGQELDCHKNFDQSFMGWNNSCVQIFWVETKNFVQTFLFQSCIIVQTFLIRRNGYSFRPLSFCILAILSIFLSNILDGKLMKQLFSPNILVKNDFIQVCASMQCYCSNICKATIYYLWSILVR